MDNLSTFFIKKCDSKKKSFYPLGDGRKIVQIGQTEPAGVCPEGVQRYAEWFSLFETQGIKTKEIRKMRISSMSLY